MARPSELSELLREQRVAVAAIKATSKSMQRNAQVRPIEVKLCLRRLLLLEMSEALIRAHKAARIDDDGLTLDLIEDALRHVGERLAREHGDGRDFRRKRLGPANS